MHPHIYKTLSIWLSLYICFHIDNFDDSILQLVLKGVRLVGLISQGWCYSASL